MSYTKESICAEIQRVASKLEQSFLKKRQFVEYSDISEGSIRYHFGTWNQAVIAAGLEVVDKALISKKALTIDDSELLSEILRLHRDHGNVTESLINSKGRFSIKPYRKRWGSIKKAVHEALALQQQGGLTLADGGDSNEEADLKHNFAATTGAGLHVPISPKPSRKRSVVGEPIDFRGMRFAPVNEQGVVYLFGMVSQELGFLVESVRVQYPDCEGKRCCDPKNNLWEHIYIEFEFKSSNFREHGHCVDDCDVIVCWLHDWPDCPIEVLELREAIRILPRSKPNKANSADAKSRAAD